MSIIDSLKEKQEAYKREAYEYYKNNISYIKTYINDKGIMIVDGPAGHNDQLDAFRHAYVRVRWQWSMVLQLQIY